MPTHWAGTRSLEPLFKAGAMENMFAFQFLDDLLFAKALDTDSTCFGTFLHDQCLDFILRFFHGWQDHCKG